MTGKSAKRQRAIDLISKMWSPNENSRQVMMKLKSHGIEYSLSSIDSLRSAIRQGHAKPTVNEIPLVTVDRTEEPAVIPDAVVVQNDSETVATLKRFKNVIALSKKLGGFDKVVEIANDIGAAGGAEAVIEIAAAMKATGF